jgi:hypothetical protein
VLTGAQLATAITAVLVAAIAVGWVLHWIWTRLASAGTDTARLAEVVQRLHEADRAREAAEQARELAENLLAAREAEMGTRIAELEARLETRAEACDAEPSAAPGEARADAETSLSGLRGAQRRIAELEAELETLRRNEGV